MPVTSRQSKRSPESGTLHDGLPRNRLRPEPLPTRLTETKLLPARQHVRQVLLSRREMPILRPLPSSQGFFLFLFFFPNDGC